MRARFRLGLAGAPRNSVTFVTPPTYTHHTYVTTTTAAAAAAAALNAMPETEQMRVAEKHRCNGEGRWLRGARDIADKGEGGETWYHYVYNRVGPHLVP